MDDEHTIFVGKKDTMSYVLALMTQFNRGDKEAVIKARGRAISKAVDIAEIAKNRFLKNAEIFDIKTDTEELDNRDGEGTVNVSSIEINVRTND